MTHTVGDVRVIFEAAYENQTPCLIAIVDYGRQRAVRAIKKCYAVPNIEVAQNKVSGSTIDDAKAVLDSISDVVDFASGLEEALSKEVECVKSSPFRLSNKNRNPLR